MFIDGVKPAATANQSVNKETIRLLVIQHGQREAARIAGLNENTVRSWAMRYGWSTPTAATKTQPNGHSALVDRITDELAENERETRLSLSRYARRASRDAEQASLKDSPYVKQAAQVAGIVHKWNDTTTEAKTFTLNVLNVNSIGVEGRDTLTLEAQSETDNE